MEKAKIEANKKYWNASAPKYDRNIKEELINESNQIWRDMILKHAPSEGKIRILDIGTGPGFFAVLLSLAGHEVTGIDSSPEMLKAAAENAAHYHVSPEFREMDVHELDFEDNTFDMVISRNVTWILYDPEKAFREWKRVLKPGGRLLYFDANWYLAHFSDEEKKKLAAGVRKYRERYDDLPPRFAMTQYEEYYRQLSLLGTQRPMWDRSELWKLRFKDIYIEEHINDQTDIGDVSKFIYSTAPSFMVRATKASLEEEVLIDLSDHWNGRAPIYGVSAVKEVKGKTTFVRDELLGLLEGKGRRVLDAGCAAGRISVMLAKEGFEVTALDHSPEMLEEVKYTEKKAGVFCRDLVQGDLNERIPLPDESYDIIIADEVLWTLTNPENALNEFMRILTGTGCLIIIDSNKYLHMDDEEKSRSYAGRWKNVSESTLNLVYGTGCSRGSLVDIHYHELPLSKQKRPEWDVEQMKKRGFCLTVQKDIPEDAVHIPFFILRFEKPGM